MWYLPTVRSWMVTGHYIMMATGHFAAAPKNFMGDDMKAMTEGTMVSFCYLW
ncbi:MAG: hypothetical protein WDN26_06720 [Chitinophagaceae bacterium]